MKKLVLFLPFLAFSLILCAQDITVPQTNKPLVVKYTASWCPYCGTWGWTLFENLIADNSGDALLVAAHYSGNYQNPTALAWYGNDNVISQPVFFVNNENQGALSGNIATVRDAVRQKVQQINGQAPVVQAGLKAQVDDTYTVEIETKARFFQDTNGEYYLGVYLVEKSYVGYQASLGDNAQHKELLRLSATPGSFGELIANGNITAGTEVEQSFTLTGAQMQLAGILDLDDLYNGDIEIATVIWKKDGAKYGAVNTNSTVVSIVSATKEEPDAVSRFNVLPNLISQQATVQLELAQALPMARLALYSLDGALLRSIYQGQLPEGVNNFTLDRGNLPGGIYFLQLASGNDVVSRKVIFR
ncbi:MAG: T9SS type A sorting domain-containing protein [Phaeodactylibacter sp.]|nr:T9SS type A sorting domain-containing protein [Phaeodactylibacter sp.]MCB9303492.1 T9SS type A sorting domain-containing protein [Lewinellaceae bacterium]